MSRNIFIAMIALFPLSASASTKHLECTQTTGEGVAQKIFVIVDDSSDKAEVQKFALGADCVKAASCGTDVYTKEVLPSVIRLAHVLRAGSTSYTNTIDIDRTTLSVVTRTKLLSAVGNSETIAHGQCTVKVDNVQKVL